MYSNTESLRVRFLGMPVHQVLLGITCLMLAGCSLFGEKPFIPAPLERPSRPDLQSVSQTSAPESRRTETEFFETPKPPRAERNSAGVRRAVPPFASDATPLETTVELDNLPLPQFINAVFAQILKRNVSVDPAVQSRNEMVSLRSGKPQTADQILSSARTVLASYGIAVNEYDGLIRVVPDTAQAGVLPDIRRGRASPDVPAGLRPVFYITDLENTLAPGIAAMVRQLFPNGRLTIQDDQQRNSLMLSGQVETVNAALEVVQLLDQPMMRSRVSARISPVHWTADELAKRMTEMLAAEGYAVATNAGANTPLLLIPVAALNSIIVFSVGEKTLNHALHWARELDQPSQARGGAYITYQVKNTDAANLAKTLQELITGVPAAAVAPPVAGAPAAARAPSQVVVNAAANSLIIKATPSEYQQWQGLLQELDRPSRSALIMATVAEIRLTEGEQFGFQWLVKQFESGGFRVNMGTFAPGTTPGAAAGNFRVLLSGLAGDPRALLSALATSNKIRILSNPSIIASNGETASLQVGQEVPILTSQVSNANTGSSSGTSGVLQTIQYRSTGVILRVKPVIHSGGRINIEVQQEVSAAQANETGVNSTPIILTRRIDTRLSVADGNTVLLGGLMQSQTSNGNAGLPYLKDIPVLGNLFRTGISENADRTELVVLLTPYVIEDDFDAQALTDAFRRQFSWARSMANVPTLKAAPMPGAKGAPEAIRAEDGEGSGKVESRRAKPYRLPPAEKQDEFVAPRQQSVPDVPNSDQPWPELPQSSGIDSNPSPAVTNVKPVIEAPVTPALGNTAPGRPVTDEKLKAELLEAIRGGR